MSQLAEFLFPAPARRSPGAILAWWEGRRLPYNLAVGSAGLVTLTVAVIFSVLPPGGLTLAWRELWIAVAAFGTLANVFYLSGPTIEILIDRIWGRSVLPVGPALYRMGLTFSVGLALFPTLLLVIAWVARVVLSLG